LVYIVKRTQIYLDDDQDRQLARRARASGRTKSDLIREAIGRFLKRQADTSHLEEALAETAGVMPDMQVPDRDEWDRDRA
jgi:predicted transcriptional regulator